MKSKFISGIGLLLVFPACSSPKADNNHTGGAGGTGGVAASAGGSGGTVSAGGSGGTKAGTGGVVSSGGTGGGPTAGTSATTGGASPGGTGGATAGGTGGAPAAGTGGTPGGGTGGSIPAAGTAGEGTSPGGMGAGGTGAGGASGGSAGAGTGGDPNTGPVTVHADQVEQTIEGFGLNTALGGGTVPWDTFFGTSGSGLGFSIVRVAMTSSAGLSGNLPAASYNAKIIGSAWTPPANCKDNNNTQKGGHLLASCVDSWSTSIANFAKAQNLYAMSAANEPDFGSCGASIGPPCNGDYDSAVYTANEMVTFVKALGPKLKAVNVKLIAPEPSEWIHLWSNASATGSTVSGHPNSSDPLKCGCFSNTPTTMGCASTCTQGNGYDYGHWLAKDSAAWSAIDIIGTHEYDTQKAEPWPSDVDGGKPSKEVWETEVSGVRYWPEEGPSSDIKNGLAVAGWVHSALTVGQASAWLYWWYQASGSNDNEGLVLQGSTALTKRCYTIGNYSKFVRPGYKRVDVSGAMPMGVLVSAYVNPTDGTVVVVAINNGSADATVPISITGGTKMPTMMTPNVTSAMDNLAAKTAVAVSGGSFMATLSASTVTTFVGM
jgi:glucuronoarabinoxylan endo-1,4-beta-xylanase